LRRLPSGKSAPRAIRSTKGQTAVPVQTAKRTAALAPIVVQKTCG
jgi:hypothetical protein